MKKLMNREQMHPILDFFMSQGLNPIVHHANNGSLFVDYTNISNYGEKYYIESRLRARDKRFRNVSKYEYDSKSEFISMCVIGEIGRQDDIYDKVKETFPEGYIIHKYIDNYSHHTWIEISHLEATKENAVAFILDYLGEDSFTAFGDNINDLGMLEAADRGFIPAESYLDKAGADFELTLSNDEDGIARKLTELFK
jgi:hydroxymethylpyrimidine pyrophosphatase-like HAD family hydrolase